MICNKRYLPWSFFRQWIYVFNYGNSLSNSICVCVPYPSLVIYWHFIIFLSPKICFVWLQCQLAGLDQHAIGLIRETILSVFNTRSFMSTFDNSMKEKSEARSWSLTNGARLCIIDRHIYVSYYIASDSFVLGNQTITQYVWYGVNNVMICFRSHEVMKLLLHDLLCDVSYRHTWW